MSNLLASIRRLPNLARKHERPVQSGEFYKVNKCGEFGFPFKPTSISYDPHLQLLAVVTQIGAIKIYGRPGVEFSAQHEERIEVVQCQFIPNQGRLVTLTSDNSLYIWELLPYKSSKDVLINTARLVDIASAIDIHAGAHAFITTLLITSDGLNLILGSNSGCVALLDLPEPTREKICRPKGFQEWKKPSSDCIFDISRVTKSLHSEKKRKFKVSPVVCLLESPGSRGQFFIGYNNGCGVIYDLPVDKLLVVMDVEQRELESACWLGDQIMTSHDDGSLITWSIRDTPIGGEAKSIGPPNMPYGPFPCKSINKIMWRETCKEKLMVFAGGMPRSTYGEKDTVSLVQGEQELCLDLTSSLVDMLIIDHHTTREPHILLLILHEELLAVNLMADKWPLLTNPFLNCLHYSDITALNFIADADKEFVRKLRRAGESSGQTKNNRCWSLQGGRLLNNNAFISSDLLLVGHADGSVDFWCLSAGDCLQKIFTLHTALMFDGDYTPPSNQEDADSENNEWPPFRRVCTFDPLSDDSRLSVTCVDLVGKDLIVGGAAGQVTVWRFTDNAPPLKTITMDVMPATADVVWKGHKALDLRDSQQNCFEGAVLKPQCLLQLSPPSNVTSLSWIGSSCLLGGGTNYGVAVAEFGHSFGQIPKPLVVRCSVPDSTRPEFVEGWARRRTREIKKSLRDSFRRLRRLRSTHGADPRRTMRQGECGGTVKAPVSELDAMEAAPVEREVDFRRQTTAVSTAVRCCVFASLHLSGQRLHTAKFKMPAGGDHSSSSAAALSAATSAIKDLTKSCLLSFFVGTSTGLVLFYRWVDDQLILWKELQLRHMAPVLELIVLDAKTHRPVSEPDSDAPVSGSQELLVVTEEQVRLFSLPSLHLKHKQRITAKDGNRVKKATVVAFSAASSNSAGSTAGSIHLDTSSNHSTDSPHVLLSNNAGQALLLSLPYLKRVDSCILPLESTDVFALTSITFAKSHTINSSDAEMSRAAGCSLPLGVFHKPPGQVCLFEVLPSANTVGLCGQNYLAYCRLDQAISSRHGEMSSSSVLNGTVSQFGDTSLSYPGSSNHPDSGIHVTSMDTSLPDSIREFNPMSSSSIIMN